MDQARSELMMQTAISAEIQRLREPISSLQNYCQSKATLTVSGVNPLIAACSALFSLASKLSSTCVAPALDVLKKDLIHEIKAFECAAQTQGYLADIILVARYAICTVLDDIIQQTDWGNTLGWEQQGLLWLFHGEQNGGESFFIILERLQREAQQGIELLEFFYFCLSVGFQGKYRAMNADHAELARITDNLYHSIRAIRGDYSMALSAPHKVLPRPTYPTKRFFSLWSIAFITGIVLVMLYAGFNAIVKITTSPLYSKLDVITHSVNHENIA